jgi:hypothetical protein
LLEAESAEMESCLDGSASGVHSEVRRRDTAEEVEEEESEMNAADDK